LLFGSDDIPISLVLVIGLLLLVEAIRHSLCLSHCRAGKTSLGGVHGVQKLHELVTHLGRGFVL
jgi:hypothetical protein